MQAARTIPRAAQKGFVRPMVERRLNMGGGWYGIKCVLACERHEIKEQTGERTSGEAYENADYSKKCHAALVGVKHVSDGEVCMYLYHSTLTVFAQCLEMPIQAPKEPPIIPSREHGLSYRVGGCLDVRKVV